MGTEFYLINDDKKEYYELGRGNWSLVFEYEPCKITERYKSDYDLFTSILEHEAYRYSLDTTLQHFYDMAKDILNWAKNNTIRLSNDNYDDDCSNRVNGIYKETGSRYF